MAKNKNKNAPETAPAPETVPAPETTETVITDGKGLRFPESMDDDAVLANAKTAWKRKHVGADGSFITNSRYTPFQGRRGDELLLFVYGSDGERNVLKLYKLAATTPCGPRTVWDD